MLKLKLQSFGHLMWTADSLEKILKLGKIEGRKKRGGDRRWDGWMASPTQWTWLWVNSGRRWRTQKPDMLQSMGLPRVRHTLATEWQQWLKNAFEIQWFFDPGKYLRCDNWWPRDFKGRQTTPRGDFLLMFELMRTCLSCTQKAYATWNSGADNKRERFPFKTELTGDWNFTHSELNRGERFFKAFKHGVGPT